MTYYCKRRCCKPRGWCMFWRHQSLFAVSVEYLLVDVIQHSLILTPLPVLVCCLVSESATRSFPVLSSGLIFTEPGDRLLQTGCTVPAQRGRWEAIWMRFRGLWPLGLLARDEGSLLRPHSMIIFYNKTGAREEIPCLAWELWLVSWQRLP